MRDLSKYLYRLGPGNPKGGVYALLIGGPEDGQHRLMAEPQLGEIWERTSYMLPDGQVPHYICASVTPNLVVFIFTNKPSPRPSD